MTAELNVQHLSQLVKDRFPDAVTDDSGDALLVKSESVADVARLCFEDPALDFDFLVGITAVDYIDYFELVYHLLSLGHNHSVTLKARTYTRESPSAPTVTDIWQGAELQEREIYDLMGIAFEGHPDMKRILLWEGFPGHPHRKDFTTA